jgi:hypothetical protein
MPDKENRSGGGLRKGDYEVTQAHSGKRQSKQFSIFMIL